MLSRSELVSGYNPEAGVILVVGTIAWGLKGRSAQWRSQRCSRSDGCEAVRRVI